MRRLESEVAAIDSSEGEQSYLSVQHLGLGCRRDLKGLPVTPDVASNPIAKGMLCAERVSLQRYGYHRSRDEAANKLGNVSWVNGGAGGRAAAATRKW